MSYEVLARKWRPQVFSDVIGQEHVTETLMNAIKNDRLAHAYLFSGARGVGKTSVARILAKAVNCGSGEPGIPCNQCHSCKEITGGSSVDVQEIDGASNRGIDEIRELRENVKYMPSSGKFRVYIIDEVHMLTKEAFNALLKTLEEPPAHVKFIFATTEPHKVPVTIISRCQRFDFKRIPVNGIIGQLEQIIRREGIEFKDSGLKIIAREAEGSMRDAESLLDQIISFAGKKVEDEDIVNILGLIDRNLLFETSLAIIEGSSEKCLEIVEKIYNDGYDIKEFYRALMDQFRNLLVSLLASGDELLDMDDEDRREVRRQAEMAGKEKLQQSLNMMIAREVDLRTTFHPRLVLEIMMIRLSRIGELLSFDDIMKKIGALEKRLSATSISQEAPPPGRLSEPGKAWEIKAPDEKQTNDPGEGSAEDVWGNLITFLTSKNKVMASMLKEWHFVKFSGNTLEITKGGSGFTASYLDDPERLDKFKGLCSEFFHHDVAVKISGRKERPSGAEDTSNRKKPASPGKRPGDLPQPVQDILQIFHGELKETGPE
ncbi:MAG: DNA polymerase III subunit gamma/tau [Deltaproteobacteria bacterium]|nr:DNA polymerase III subunit gamma/tau [Deltaproteobacteria bacterium]